MVESIVLSYSLQQHDMIQYNTICCTITDSIQPPFESNLIGEFDQNSSTSKFINHQDLFEEETPRHLFGVTSIDITKNSQHWFTV